MRYSLQPMGFRRPIICWKSGTDYPSISSRAMCSQNRKYPWGPWYARKGILSCRSLLQDYKNQITFYPSVRGLTNPRRSLNKISIRYSYTLWHTSGPSRQWYSALTFRAFIPDLLCKSSSKWMWPKQSTKVLDHLLKLNKLGNMTTKAVAGKHEKPDAPSFLIHDA